MDHPIIPFHPLDGTAILFQPLDHLFDGHD
jgi:hypothetical protein